MPLELDNQPEKAGSHDLCMHRYQRTHTMLTGHIIVPVVSGEPRESCSVLLPVACSCFTIPSVSESMEVEIWEADLVRLRVHAYVNTIMPS